MVATTPTKFVKLPFPTTKELEDVLERNRAASKRLLDKVLNGYSEALDKEIQGLRDEPFTKYEEVIFHIPRDEDELKYPDLVERVRAEFGVNGWAAKLMPAPLQDTVQYAGATTVWEVTPSISSTPPRRGCL